MVLQSDCQAARIQQVMELSSYMVRKHYCENDSDALIALMDREQLIWQGAGELEYAADPGQVIRFFQDMKGVVPTCRLSGENYRVMPLSPDIYLCSGQYWLETDPSTKMYLRVHQRITLVFRYTEDQPRCCHIHISNPYSEMEEDEVGFPAKMGHYSYQYLQEQINAQAARIQSQTAILKRVLMRDSLTGMYNRHKFNQDMSRLQRKSDAPLGIAYFDLNGLKQVNDRMGHDAGDRLLFRTASHIMRYFEQQSYRVGGDEFVVMDDQKDEAAFRQMVDLVCLDMRQDNISCSVGLCWRDVRGNVEEQFNEADHLMYREKQRHYRTLDGSYHHL